MTKTNETKIKVNFSKLTVMNNGRTITIEPKKFASSEAMDKSLEIFLSYGKRKLNDTINSKLYQRKLEIAEGDKEKAKLIELPSGEIKQFQDEVINDFFTGNLSNGERKPKKIILDDAAVARLAKEKGKTKEEIISAIEKSEGYEYRPSVDIENIQLDF